MRKLIFILAIVALLAMFLMSGCTRTIRSVERGDTVWVERHTTDTLFVQSGRSDSLFRASSDTITKTIVRHDTINTRDSVFVKVMGDTTYIYREKVRERVVNHHDTLWTTHTDTLWRFKADTILVYRSATDSDSVYSSREEKVEKVKKRQSKWWIWVLGLIAQGIFLWWWKRHKG